MTDCSISYYIAVAIGRCFCQTLLKKRLPVMPMTRRPDSNYSWQSGRICREGKKECQGTGSLLQKWVLDTPEDFVDSATRKMGGDVTWFEGLRQR